MPRRSVFVQVGATRDGLDPYLRAAHLRDFDAVLLETPEYLRLRRHQNRVAFDREVAVSRPERPAEVIGALRDVGGDLALVLPGFERYVHATYAATRALSLPPGGDAPAFQAPYKAGQRETLRLKGPTVLQPRYALVDSLRELTSASYDLCPPVVVKPGDGGAGLGVMLVSQLHDLPHAVTVLRHLRNYGGGAFTSWLIEEQVSGIELSIQAVARDGGVRVLTFCQKVVSLEPRLETALLCGFRESGHVARPGHELEPGAVSFAEECIKAVGYRTGPFHIDLVRSDGALYFLEMGFRLSGMHVVELVDHVAGLSWADESFRAYLGETPGVADMDSDHPYMGHLTVRSEAQLGFADKLATAIQDADIAIAPAYAALSPSEERIPPRLYSDLKRHADAVGRVSVTASNPRLIEHLFQCCVTMDVTG